MVTEGVFPGERPSLGAGSPRVIGCDSSPMIGCVTRGSRNIAFAINTDDVGAREITVR
jgi:hypothetical protein